MVHGLCRSPFYPFANIRWTIPELDTPSFARCKKLHGFPIHEPNLLQVKRDNVGFIFRLDKLFQLWHMRFLDPATQSEDR
jgi:hypothetical protein